MTSFERLLVMMKDRPRDVVVLEERHSQIKKKMVSESFITLKD